MKNSYRCQLLIALLTALPLVTAAKEKLTVEALNSPVKESFLKLRLVGDPTISTLFLKPKNGGEEVEVPLKREGSQIFAEFRVSHLPPGPHEFRARTLSQSGKSANATASSVAFLTFVVDASLEVADPGEAGKAALLGIDSDKDGVRDDVQRWINESYPEKESTKKGLKQLSRVMNSRLSSVKNKEASIADSHLLEEALGCLSWIDIDASIESTKKLRKKFNNTAERIQLSLEADNNFHGQSSGSRRMSLEFNQLNQLCDFTAQKNN